MRCGDRSECVPPAVCERSAEAGFCDPRNPPWQNAWIESFNGRLRDEFLNGWQFDNLLEVQKTRGPVHLARTTKALANRADRAGIDQPISELNNALQQAFAVDRRTWFMQFLDTLGWGDEPERTRLATDLGHLYWLTFGRYNIPYDDAIHFIEHLLPHVRIGMITDGYRFNQQSKLYSSGLSRYFDVSTVVFSDDVGVMKPDVRIFEHALERFDAEAATTVYIGDKIAKDVRGANAAGIRSILLRRGRNAFEPVGDDMRDCPDIEVRSFYELLDRCVLAPQAGAA